jgi:hypothetical protein
LLSTNWEELMSDDEEIERENSEERIDESGVGA